MLTCRTNSRIIGNSEGETSRRGEYPSKVKKPRPVTRDAAPTQVQFSNLSLVSNGLDRQGSPCAAPMRDVPGDRSNARHF